MSIGSLREGENDYFWEMNAQKSGTRWFNQSHRLLPCFDNIASAQD
jgi:hypothetical protein